MGERLPDAMTYLHSNAPRRDGLTLIELLVVLTILIALGGIVVASLPGLLERTQSATAAANVPEIDAAIRRQLITAHGVVGNRFDSLIAAGSGEIANFVGGKSYFQPVTLNEEDVQALARIGLTELIPAQASPVNATFESHQSLPVAIAKDTKVCAVAGPFAVEMMEQMWNLTPSEDSRFLVFGLGGKCSLVGGSATALFPEAPVHFSDAASTGPENMYSRYLIVIELTSPPEATSRARYVGVAIPDTRGLRGISQELQEVYSSQTTLQ